MSSNLMKSELKTSGLWAAFNNLKVKTKVLTGFAFVLTILVAVSAVGYLGFSKIDGQFTHYASAVDVVIDSGEIELDMVKLRRDIDNLNDRRFGLGRQGFAGGCRRLIGRGG